MIFNIVCFALSIFFFFYFILMQILSPEPFFRIFVSFSTVWLMGYDVPMKMEITVEEPNSEQRFRFLEKRISSKSFQKN